MSPSDGHITEANTTAFGSYRLDRYLQHMLFPFPFPDLYYIWRGLLHSADNRKSRQLFLFSRSQVTSSRKDSGL